MTIQEIVKQQKSIGKSAIEIHKYLRDTNRQVPFVLVQKLYQEAK